MIATPKEIAAAEKLLYYQMKESDFLEALDSVNITLDPGFLGNYQYLYVALDLLGVPPEEPEVYCRDLWTELFWVSQL